MPSGGISLLIGQERTKVILSATELGDFLGASLSATRQKSIVDLLQTCINQLSTKRSIFKRNFAFSDRRNYDRASILSFRV